MVIVARQIFVPSADVDSFLAEARGSLPLGRSADGNLFLSFTLDDREKGSVTVLERWSDQDSLRAYLKQPHVIDLFTRWGPKMRSEVRLYDAANERSPLGN